MKSEWERVLGNAKLSEGNGRFGSLVRRALSWFPKGMPPLKSVTKVQVKRRSQVRGIVGLTTHCCVEVGAKEASRKQRRGGSQRITFYRELLDQLSDEAAIGVIAHELAHSWLNEHSKPAASRRREDEADELTRAT